MKNTFAINILLFVTLFFGTVQAQETQVKIQKNPAATDSKSNYERYRDKRIHFGFLLGLDRNRQSIQLRENYQNLTHPSYILPVNSFNESTFQESTFQYTNIKDDGGIGGTLGILCDIQMGPMLSLRFSPSLTIGDSFVTYETKIHEENGEVYDLEFTSKNLNYNHLEFPIHLLINYHLKRFNNFGVHLLMGGNPRMTIYDRKTMSHISLSHISYYYRPPFLQTKPFDVALEFGGGLDYYGKHCRIGLDFKMSYGLINVLKTDDLSMNSFYGLPIHDVKNRCYMVAFTIL